MKDMPALLVAFLTVDHGALAGEFLEELFHLRLEVEPVPQGQVGARVQAPHVAEQLVAVALAVAGVFLDDIQTRVDTNFYVAASTDHLFSSPDGSDWDQVTRALLEMTHGQGTPGRRLEAFAALGNLGLEGRFLGSKLLDVG